MKSRIPILKGAIKMDISSTVSSTASSVSSDIAGGEQLTEASKKALISDYSHKIKLFKQLTNSASTGAARKECIENLENSIKGMIKSGLDKASLKSLITEAYKAASPLEADDNKYFPEARVGFMVRGFSMSLCELGLFSEAMELANHRKSAFDKEWIVVQTGFALSKSTLDKNDLKNCFKQGIKIALTLENAYDGEEYHMSGPDVLASGWYGGRHYKQENLELIREQMSKAGLSNDEIKQVFIDAAIEKYRK